MAVAGCATLADAEVTATALRDGDVIVVSREANDTAIEIRSERGIGSAIIARQGPRWPATLRLRLFLNGLESLRISGAGHTARLSFSQDGRAHLDAPAGMLTDAVRTADGFSLLLATSLLADSSRIELHWVDFFR